MAVYDNSISVTSVINNNWLEKIEWEKMREQVARKWTEKLEST